MTHSRLDNTAERSLEVAISGLETQLQDLRSSAPQYVGGTSVRYYSSQAPGNFDWTGLLNDTTGLGVGGKLFLITATAQTMATFYGGIKSDLYMGSSTTLYDGLKYMQDFAAGNTTASVSFTDAPNDTTAPSVKKWFAQVTGDSSQTYWVKFTVVALDIVNVSITALT